MNIQADQEIISLSEICRVCLIKTNNMKHLLEPNEEIIQIISKLSAVSNIAMEINDTLPCYLCHNCEDKLKISYDFQQLCLKSHNFILACLSASTVSFKVNSLKPLNFEDTPEKTEIPQLENDSNEFGFLNNELEKKLLPYNSVPDIPNISADNVDGLKDNQENTLTCSGQTFDILKDVKDETKEEVADEYVKLQPVERRTRYNQTMRLAQYPVEVVQKIIKKIRARFLKPVDCMYCGFKAKDLRSLSIHMTRSHKENKNHWCFWCNENFNNLPEHKKNAHKDEFKCPLCGRYKINTGRLIEHLGSHTVERSHTCPRCGKCFISDRHLRMHFKVHTKQKPYRCHICLKVYPLMKSLTYHLEIHKKEKCRLCGEFLLSKDDNAHKCLVKTEPEDRPIVSENGVKVPQNFCKICNKRVRSLHIHLKKNHATVNTGEAVEKKEQELKALCSYCGKGFKNVAKMSIHMRTHTGDMPYKCSYCDKRMSTKIHLVVHERTHTGEKPHICKFCGKGFSQHSVLNTHMRQHTGKPEECSTCHKRFCRPSELKLHMRTHTGEKPYECSICGKGFAQNSHLICHSRKHTNERPYNCKYCDKSFKQAKSLQNHTYIHLGEKPYKCSQCPYAARAGSSLKRHLLEHNTMPKLKGLHKCEICGQVCMTYEIYVLHYNNEHGPLEEESIVKDNLIEVTEEVIEHLEEFT